MKNFIATCCIALACAAASAMAGPTQPEQASLEATIASLDTAVFEAFNHCRDPAQLRKHAAFFAEDVEFYHDTGGATWTREAMLDNTRNHACGRYTRELVPGSLHVFPIKDFVAIAQGVHRFCQAGGQRCEGEADFAMIWRLRDGTWQITRVLSYGHRPSTNGTGTTPP